MHVFVCPRQSSARKPISDWPSKWPVSGAFGSFRSTPVFPLGRKEYAQPDLPTCVKGSAAVQWALLLDKAPLAAMFYSEAVYG